MGGQDGYYVLHYSALDVAGNQEVEHRLTFALDTHGPAVLNAVTTPVPQGVNVTVSISDPLPDEVQSATLFYRNGQSAFSSAQLRNLAGSNFWSGILPGAQRGVQVCYYISATDQLGNTATNGTEVTPICFSSENHAPSLAVSSPQDQSQVQGSFEVRWSTSDIDNDPVSVAISYRLKSAVELIPVSISPEEQGARSKIVNASELVTGDYLLRVEASDNQPFNNRTRVDLSFTVGNGTLLSRPTFPTDVAPGQAIKVTVQVGKPVDSIEARLLKDGQVAARQAMEQDPPGTRTYTATFHVSDPGNYEVEVRGTFSDGTPFVVRGASPIRVQGGGLNIGSPETLGILVVGIAVIALAAAGLRRRGL
ncbi:MAG: hypothetical protein LC624_01865 [Halobacteriales archaeon]|nr:hypothetical protein [Halobacteriales archaeon]